MATGTPKPIFKGQIFHDSVSFLEKGKVGDAQELPGGMLIVKKKDTPMKQGLSDEQQQKVRSLYLYATGAGMTEEQATVVLGLVDHESVGTWNENIKGDKGCSRGIAQWNKCAGRIAPKTFDEQAKLIAAEMKEKFDKHTIRKAISLHNAPGYPGEKTAYVNKVLASTKLFK